MTNEPMTRTLLFAVLVVGIGSSFNLGFGVGVFNIPDAIVKQYLAHMLALRDNATTEEHPSNETLPVDNMYQSQAKTILAVINSIFMAGAAISGLFASILVNKYGRKPVLLWNNLLAIVAGILMGCFKMAKSYELLISGRLLMGLNVGLNASAAILYLNEISPLSKRGAIGSVFQLSIVAIILLAQILGLPQILGTLESFEWLLFIQIPPAVMMMVGMFFLPESPRFILSSGRDESEARKALVYLRGEEADFNHELNQMKQEVEESNRAPAVKLADFWKDRLLRIPLLVSFVVMMGQQLSGNNAVMIYSNQIFRDAGLDGDGPNYATIGMGVVNLIQTVVSMLLVDRLGRKTLLMTGTGGMMVFSLILCVSMSLQNASSFAPKVSVVGVYIFIIFFATGPGSIPWFIVSEMFNINAKGLAQSLCLGVNFSSVFLIGLTYPYLADLCGTYTFLIFTAINASFLIFTNYRIPETKGKTIDEVIAFFKNDSSSNHHYASQGESDLK